MSKPAIPLIAALFAISTVYDFYRGYHDTHSVAGGIVYVIFGLVTLAILFWLYSTRRKSN